MIKKGIIIAVFILLLIGLYSSMANRDSGIDGLHIPVRFEPINSVDINNSGLYTDREGTILHISKATDSEILNSLNIDLYSTVTELDNGMLRISGTYDCCNDYCNSYNSYCGVKTIQYWELVEYKNTHYIVDVRGKDIDLSIDKYSYINEELLCEELKKDLDEFNSINNVEPLDINI